jgi:RHS repeat-associated protein
VTGAGWLITKYDVFNRVVYTGWLNSPATSSTRGTMQQAQTNATTINESKQNGTTIDGIAVNYSNNVLPNTFKLLTVNYYDNYTIPSITVATSVEGQTVATMVKGLATGSWTRVPTTTAEVKAETNYVLYDYKYRPIRSYTTNYLGGSTCTDSKLDAFSGQLQYTLQKHKRTSGDAELIVKDAFTYSAQNRLLTHTHQINGGAEQLLAENTYDELGKLTSKKVGNTSALPLQKVDYSYNIRGWLTQINEIKALQKGTDPKDLFGFTINYNTVDGSASAASPLYNGNIAETFWQFGDDGDLVYRGYGYKYDSLNRLKDASYQRPGFSNAVPKSYDENLTYDKNGNIMTLKRNGDADDQLNLFTIDDLSYEYLANSNKLMRVSEAQITATSGFKDGNTTGDDYDYDDNGNLIKDKNKNITTAITYNHLNLPIKIIFPTGNIVYIYTASGQKMQKIVTEGTSTTTTDYLGGYQYQNTVLQFFPTAEGYVKNTPVSGTNAYSYVFNYTDHLGNVRLSYTKNPSTNALTILEESNYYPFGLKHNGYNIDNFQPEYKYRFGGKELQDELSLNMYDYGARGYDPAIGRFSSIDPLAELSRRWTPYNYAYNNPMYFVDPDGMLSKSFMDDLIKKSDDNKETKWTFNDDGSASGSNGASVNAEESEQQASSDSSGDQDKDKDKNKGKKTPRPSYTPAPKSLPGFPDAEKVKPKGGRPRWRLPDGDIIEWDGQHGELERYNPRGKHKGVWSPDGEEIKDPVPGRKIDPVLTPPSPTNNSPFMDHMAKATGLSGTALIIYIILSEGSRAFPPRNLVPIP